MMMLNNRNNNRLANVLFILCVIVLLLVVQTSNVLAQRNNGRLQRTTCPRGQIKAQRKTISDDFKEVYMAYNRRPYTVTDMDIKSNLPMPESNGCTTMGIKVGGEEDFTSCCDLHDVCYQTCGLTQQKCDKLFEKCMHVLCVETFPSNPQCVQAAQMYSMGVSMFGGGGFVESEEVYCKCIKEDDVPKHYEELFLNFYKAFGDKSLSDEDIQTKVTKLIPTNDGTNKIRKQDFKKMFRTFYKLMEKYPHSIKHVLTRIGKTPPPVPEKKKKKAKKKEEL